MPKADSDQSEAKASLSLLCQMEDVTVLVLRIRPLLLYGTDGWWEWGRVSRSLTSDP